MRVTKEQLFIMRLKRELPPNPRLNWLREMTDEQCFEKLRELTGQTFGTDLKAWAYWVSQQVPPWEEVSDEPFNTEAWEHVKKADQESTARVLETLDDSNEVARRLKAKFGHKA